MKQLSRLTKDDIHKYLSKCNFTNIGLLSETECFIEKCKGFTIEEISLKHSVSIYKVKKLLRLIKRKMLRVLKHNSVNII